MESQVFNNKDVCRKKFSKSLISTKIYPNGRAYVQEEQEKTFHLLRCRDFHLVFQRSLHGMSLATLWKAFSILQTLRLYKAMRRASKITKERLQDKKSDVETFTITVNNIRVLIQNMCALIHCLNCRIFRQTTLVLTMVERIEH